MMIHRTFEVPKWLERTLIYVGVLVGMSGPFGIIRIHDTRDWAQRQAQCHDFFSHTRPFWQDLFWQLTCKFEYDSPPRLVIEKQFAEDIVYQFLEHTWRWQQLLLAMVLYQIGGFDLVVWGVFVRVAVSIVGHWTITYFCHTAYEQSPTAGKWKVKNVAVQASNLKGLGYLTYGECWHNNHHAFPESAQIGLEDNQPDPAYWFIDVLARNGLATNVGKPRVDKLRDDLIITD